MGDSSARQIANHRLDSWKEIALFFGRDERTVKRWEKERGLPVYRVPGRARGGVFAYAHELDGWLQGTAVDEAPSAVEQEATKVLTWESSVPPVEPSSVHD